MKISGPQSTSAPGSARRTGKTGSSGDFRRALDELSDKGEAAGVEMSSAVSGIDALLAAQSVGDATDQESRRRMVRRGEDILDQLEDIRRGLLTGAIDKQQLMRLASQLRARRESVADPRLMALLDEIELRAEVELAKLTRRP